MHKILMAAAVLLAGCTSSIDGDDVAWAVQQCADRGGLDWVTREPLRYQARLITASCKDASSVAARRGAK